MQEQQARNKRSGVRQDLDKCPKGGTPAVKGGDVMSYHNFTFRLEDKELEWLRERAKAQNRSVGNLIREILEEYKLRETAPF